MKKNKLFRIASISFIALIICLLIIYTLMDRMPMNPEGTVGNTAGNINNAGLFCEKDGVVYFSNVYDNGHLYSMNADETNVKQLNSLHVRNILGGGDYLYFFQMGDPGESGVGSVITTKSFNRCNLSGNNITTITRDVTIKAQLVDNYLYMMTSKNSKLSFYKMKIDKSEKKEIADYDINPACARDGIIYYNGTQNDHYLYALDTRTDESHSIFEGDIWYPVLYGDYVYYMDVQHNYRLCRYSFSQNRIEVLTEDRVDCYNIGSGLIYYQTSIKNPALKCMRTDGSDLMTIAEGNFTNINLTSMYVYFQEFGLDGIYYHAPLGSNAYEIFAP